MQSNGGEKNVERGSGREATCSTMARRDLWNLLLCRVYYRDKWDRLSRPLHVIRSPCTGCAETTVLRANILSSFDNNSGSFLDSLICDRRETRIFSEESLQTSSSWQLKIRDFRCRLSVLGEEAHHKTIFFGPFKKRSRLGSVRSEIFIGNLITRMTMSRLERVLDG